MEHLPIAVLFSTFNGAETLPRTLAGYERVEDPGIAWRIVVVDNNSSDETPGILANFRDRLPLTVLHEPQAGKNVALNHALREVAPELAIFTDDDAVPATDFLTAWCRAAREHAKHELFGGTVTPRFVEPPPAWLEAADGFWGELFARNERAEGEIPAAHIYGPNMAVRGSVLAAGHRFDEAIGPNGAKVYAMGSETEFCVRVEREHGARAWFAPEPSVGHIVRPWQMTPEFFAGRAFRHGSGVARQLGRAGRGPRMMTRAYLGRAWHGAAIRLGGPERAQSLWQHHWYRGYLDEMAGRAGG